MVFSTNVTDAVVCNEDSYAEFNVEVYATDIMTDVTYQWYINDVPQDLANFNEPTLVIDPVGPDYENTYVYCVVTAKVSNVDVSIQSNTGIFIKPTLSNLVAYNFNIESDGGLIDFSFDFSVETNYEPGSNYYITFYVNDKLLLEFSLPFIPPPPFNIGVINFSASDFPPLDED